MSDPTGRVRKRAIVRGSVQGVFYRASCQEKARELGVQGWIENRSDGAVEAVFEGQQDAVDALVAWSRKGPRYAVVEKVEVTSEEPQGETGFSER